MDTIRNITFIACYLGIAISILDLVSPGEKLKKQLRLIFSLVFLIAIATPFIKGDVKLDIPAIEPIEQSDRYIEAENTFKDSLIAKVKSNIEQELKQKLEAAEIAPKEISANVNIDDKNCISISEVEIVLAVQDKNQSQKVIQTVKNEIGNVSCNIKTSDG